MAVSLIDYDTSIMRELSAACRTAALELSRAESLIEQVRSHNDWTCKEKNTIDDLMAACRKMVRQLSEQQSDFLQAVEKTEEEFAEAERSISVLFDGVEDVLGRILSIPVGTVSITGGGLLERLAPTGNAAGTEAEAAGALKQDGMQSGVAVSSIVEHMKKTLDIAVFSDIEL